MHERGMNERGISRRDIRDTDAVGVEEDLHDLLENGFGAEPPIVGGPEAVFAGARARVLRTRALTGALSVAAVLGVAAGAVAVGGHAAGGRGGGVAPLSGAGVPAADAGTTTAPPAGDAKQGNAQGGAVTSGKKGALAAHPAPKPEPGSVLIDGRSTTELLKQLLPAGFTPSQYFGQDSYRPEQGGVQTYGAMAIDDGKGLGTVGLNVEQNMGDVFRGTDSQSETLADGSRIDVYPVTSDKTAARGYPQAVTLMVDRVFPNGLRIVVGVSNYFDSDTVHDKGWTVKPARAGVPLTVDQLKAIVSDPRWDSMTVTAQFAEQARHDLVGYKDETQK